MKINLFNTNRKKNSFSRSCDTMETKNWRVEVQQNNQLFKLAEGTFEHCHFIGKMFNIAIKAHNKELLAEHGLKNYYKTKKLKEI
jgi:hypothetical protein